MASLKTLEIDTLRLRNLLVATKDNTFIPADYHIYSKGDGTTFWSTGVTAIQFINLSTTVSTFQSTNASEHKEIISTFTNFQEQIISTLYGFSTFSINLSTYSISLKYTDDEIAKYSTQITSYIANTYQTRQETAEITNLLSSLITSTNANIVSQVSTLSSVTESLNKQTALNFSTNIITTSSYTGSTFAGIFSQENISRSTLQTSIINNSLYLQNNINNLSTNVGSRLDTFNFNSVQTNLDNAVSTLSSSIFLNGQSIYKSSLSYADALISTISTSMYYSISLLNTTTNNNINTQITNISSQLSSYIFENNNNISTFIGKQSTINNNLTAEVTLLVNKGLTQQLYNTFLELEAYSAGIVESTISTVNNEFISTISSFTSFYSTSLNNANTSTYNLLVKTSYLSSISTLLPFLESTLTSSINGNESSFTSTIDGLSSTFAVNIEELNKTNIEEVTAIIDTNIASVKELLAGVQSQVVNIIGDTVASLKLGETSTFFQTQFKTAPSIIMNSVDNLVTIRNSQNATGLDSLVASVINLDLSTYDNFYIYVSDISSDVFYGLTYTPSPKVVSKDINLHIDITSSYTNKFLTIDTSNLSNWLQKPKIYNQGPYGLFNTNMPQIYLSTFLGAHIVQMRLDRNVLYIRDILTVPYIYTNMTLKTYTINDKIVPNNPLLQNSTFLYCGTDIPVTWTTNDLNVSVGIKFEGVDQYGKRVISWSGPYSSAQNLANIKAPYGPVLVQYDKMYLSIYPPSGFSSAPVSGNIPGNSQVFDTKTLNPPLIVYTPSYNSKITIYNPGTVGKILEVSELIINNQDGINVVGENYQDYITLTSTSSYPYQGDFSIWRTDNIFDGSEMSAFRGGQDANIIDYNAYISCELRATTPGRISSIEVYGSENNDSLFSIDGLLLKVENKNEPGIQDGLFSKIVTLNARTPNVIQFN